MKQKPLFSTEQLLRGEVTRDMARQAGKPLLKIPDLKLTGGRQTPIQTRRRGGRADA